mmetsp:Transcript_34697/g.82952  ORF Transcript_34697/g.82952 Transcript_34697/m.82952 type:complete len:114 (+) Transcript_34697:255-596(+)
MGMHARRPPTLKPGVRRKSSRTSGGENAVAGGSLRVPSGSNVANRVETSPKKSRRYCCRRKTVCLFILVVVVLSSIFLVLKRLRAQEDSVASGSQPSLRGAQEERHTGGVKPK